MCVSCGHCIAMCPTNAIIHEDFPNYHAQPINKELIPNFDSLNELFKARRSIRNFTSKPVEKELIKKAIDAAQFSPSTNNLQTTKYIVVQDKDTIEKIIHSLTSLELNNKDWEDIIRSRDSDR